MYYIVYTPEHVITPYYPSFYKCPREGFELATSGLALAAGTLTTTPSVHIVLTMSQAYIPFFLDFTLHSIKQDMPLIIFHCSEC